MHNQAERYRETIAGLKTLFIVAGKGEPLLLIHGLGSSIIPWHHNIEALAQHFRVYAMDLPGHGLSEKPNGTNRYTLDESVQFLHAFCERLQLDQVNLLGRSMGGLLAFAFALRYPERVKKLVVSGSAGIGREVGFPLRILTLPLLGEFLAQPKPKRTRRTWEWLFYDKKLVPADLVREDQAIQALPGNAEALLEIARYGINVWGQKKHIVITDSLRELHVPVLVLWGRNDRVIPISHALIATQLIPNARYHIFEDCGHYPQIEKAEEFNRVVLEFLS